MSTTRVTKRIDTSPERVYQAIVTYASSTDGGATELIGTHENLPPDVSPEANEVGCRMSLDKLARLVET